MTGIFGSYVMAISAMCFAACSGLTLFYAVRHFDPPSEELPQGTAGKRTAA